ncbi:hypothetical protein M413DRAFT_25620 [Hebeloma cylindrosporum]|uniref:F-box domain-containing protein n=1 Tax=Hebeloma cylindrosporum TaxID=76867 RepID=A0A0C3CK82_HEBCY|nr:hypothetical protein M413DRAFT_25620 [Hebeloma cylindrosporum h7]
MSKVIDDKRRAGCRREAYATSTSRINRRKCRKSSRRPVCPVFFVFSEQTPARGMPALALDGRGAPVKTFKKFPYLTRHIHTYHIEQLGTYSPREDSWDLLRPGPALSAMRNLKNLHIKAFHGNIADDILLDCPFQLVSFSWIFHVETGRIGRLLDGLLALPACDNLEHLRGDRGSIETFLPGRSVTSLIWIPGWGDSTDDINLLAKEFGEIQDLTFHTSYGSQHVVGFNTVAPYLKNLQCLELSTFSLELLDCVDVLPSLIGLILSKAFQYLWRNPNERHAIFLRCNRLSFLDIELGDDKSTLPRRFDRYDRYDCSSTYHRAVSKRFFNSFAEEGMLNT